MPRVLSCCEPPAETAHSNSAGRWPQPLGSMGRRERRDSRALRSTKRATSCDTSTTGLNRCNRGTSTPPGTAGRKAECGTHASRSTGLDAGDRWSRSTRSDSNGSSRGGQWPAFRTPSIDLASPRSFLDNETAGDRRRQPKATVSSARLPRANRAAHGTASPKQAWPSPAAVRPAHVAVGDHSVRNLARRAHEAGAAAKAGRASSPSLRRLGWLRLSGKSDANGSGLRLRNRTACPKATRRSLGPGLLLRCCPGQPGLQRRRAG